MIKAILVDDEPHCLETLSILLSDYCPEVRVVEQCFSGAQAIEAVEKWDPELVFLDIEMPSMNGFEFLEKFKNISFSVVFTTGYDQYAIKAIRFSALDYLLKPISPKDLMASIKRVQNHTSPPLMEQFHILLEQLRNKDYKLEKVAIPTNDGFLLIPVDQIAYCKSDNNYTRIYLKNKTKIVACRTIKEIAEQLQDFSSFIRVHNSFVVNLNEVAKYVRGDGGYLVMNEGTTVNVSRSRKDLLLKKILSSRD